MLNGHRSNRKLDVLGLTFLLEIMLYCYHGSSNIGSEFGHSPVNTFSATPQTNSFRQARHETVRFDGDFAFRHQLTLAGL